MDLHDLDNYSVPPLQLNPFSIASFVCGLLSSMLCCTGLLSFFFGAFGILFAVLSRRLGKPAPPLSAAGMFLSCLGLVLGLFVCLAFVYEYLTDENYRAMFNQIYQQYNSGMNLN